MSSYFLCLVHTYVSSNYAILTHAKYIDLDTLEYSVLDIRELDADSLKISSRMQEVLKDRLGKEVYLPDRNSVDESKFELLGIPIDRFGYAVSYPSGRLTIRESILYFTDSVFWDKHYTKPFLSYLLERFSRFAQEDLTVSEASSLPEIVSSLSKYVRVEFI